jgi:hypothetical protein
MNLASHHRYRSARALVAAPVAVLVAALVAVTLAGCGVRIESPPPSEPTPDAAEQLRRDAVSDARKIANLATFAMPPLPEALQGELGRIKTDAQAYAAALGGVYVSGLPCPTVKGETASAPPSGQPCPTPTPTLSPGGSQPPVAPTRTPDVTDVVAALIAASDRNRAVANTTEDGAMARLLASIGAGQQIAALRLAALAGVPGPDPVAPTMPSPDVAYPSVTATAPAATSSPSATHEPSGTPTATSPSPDPEVPPLGLTVTDFATIVLAEDAARYAFEVGAAKADGDLRTGLLALAQKHGSRAQAWALLGGIAGTAQDPRRVAYELPRDGDVPTLVATVEAGLAANYAGLIATTGAGTRAILINLLIDSAQTLNAWGAAPVTFPGISPEPASASPAPAG